MDLTDKQTRALLLTQRGRHHLVIRERDADSLRPEQIALIDELPGLVGIGLMTREHLVRSDYSYSLTAAGKAEILRIRKLNGESA